MRKGTSCSNPPLPFPFFQEKWIRLEWKIHELASERKGKEISRALEEVEKLYDETEEEVISNICRKMRKD